MIRKFTAAAVLGAALFAAAPASAHFQLLYTPNAVLDQAGDVPFKLVFWHPMENGHAMDMGAPEAFYMMFKGKKIDLMDRLAPITFNGASNQSKAYEASVPVKRNGDYSLVVVPAPYYEQSEDIFIQQITKAVINKGEMPTDWNEPLGLPAEILPLSKPYGALAGSTFSAIVMADGKPVPGAEVEIEYISALPDMASNAPGPVTAEPVPGGALVAVTDANGVFTFGIPKAGVWGFAALGVGPATEYQGKPLSQDAVLWIYAHDFGAAR